MERMSDTHQGREESGEVIIPEAVDGGGHAFYRTEDQAPVVDEFPELHMLIDSNDWDAVQERLKSNPEEIHPSDRTRPNSSSSTALHLALETGDCPFNILRMMLEMEPLLPSKKDENDNTPLHIACGGEFAFDPLVLAMLLAAYPQAVLFRDRVEKTTPLHMLLVKGGDVNLTCVSLLLDVAYSCVAGLPETYVLGLEFLTSNLDTSLAIAQHYPPLVTQVVREMAQSDPYGFPAFLRPFLHLPKPCTFHVKPQLMENQKKLLLIQDGVMQVPMHIAARKGARRDVVELLLQEERYPGAHEACQVLERKQRYPLHYCSFYDSPHDSSLIIYEAFKEALDHHELYGLNPFTGACTGSPNYSLEEKAMEVIGQRHDSTVPIQDYFRLEKSHAFYGNIHFYLRLKYQGHDGTRNFSVLHAAASVVTPPKFLRSSIALFPWQLEETDAKGNLPLHLACKVERPLGHNSLFYWLKKDMREEIITVRLIPEDCARDNPITILTEAHPKAASTLDADGNLPLHSAILSGKKFEDGIQSLVNAAPMALSTPNMSTRLYPFMTAALVGDVQLTFSLLLANPMMVLSGIVKHAKSDDDVDWDVNGKRARV